MQSQLTTTLDYIESQQSQLDKELDAFESKLLSLLRPDSSSSQQSTTLSLSTFSPPQQPSSSYLSGSGISADQAREETYTMAERLSHDITLLNTQLNDVVKSVSQVWKVDPEDPISMITKILNEHHNHLVWVENSCLMLSQKVSDVKKVSGEMGIAIPSGIGGGSSVGGWRG